MYNDVIKLVSQSTIIDEYGDHQTTETSREVFVKVVNVGQKEFYQAQAVGLKPEIKFILPDFLEYDDELIVDYELYASGTKRYRVIRTYRNNNELELVCVRGID